jgi:Rrf2 family protein
MFITREADYAVRIIRELAHGNRETVQRICEQERVPLPYGYKILKKLEKGGLVRSFRGTKGGYALARETGRITLFDVIGAVDGDLIVHECLHHGFVCPLDSGKKRCAIHQEFLRIQQVVVRELSERTLAEIL